MDFRDALCFQSIFVDCWKAVATCLKLSSFSSPFGASNALAIFLSADLIGPCKTSACWSTDINLSMFVAVEKNRNRIQQ